MASTDRKIYKIIQKSLSTGSKSLSPSDKNVTIPYKQLHHKSSGTLTNFEKFIKVKLVDAKAQTNSQKRLNKQSERMYSFDKSLPIPTNSDQICITHESKRSEIRALSSERKPTNHTNASILNLQTQLTQNTQHSSDLTTMDSFFRSRSQGKLNRDIKKIARLSVEAQNRTNERSFYGKLIKQKSSQEKKESQEKIPKLSQINNFHCFLNNKAYLSPRPGAHELSKGVSLGQIRKELGISLTDRDVENNKSISLIQKNAGKNEVESYHMKKSIYVNPQKLAIPIRHFVQSIVHQEDQTSKEAAEISKESFSNVQVYDPSVQDGGISPNEHFIINKRQIQDSFEDTTDKHSSLSICQSSHDNETERAIRSRSKDFIKLYSYSGLINSDRATSPLNSSRTYTREKTSLFPSDLKKEYLPEWLEQRNDFKKACRGMLGKGRESVPNAVMKPSYNRTADEIEIVATWLEKVKVFRMLPKPLIYSIVEKIKVRTYRRNQILCYQGDPGDCLYIVYNGIIRCLVDGVPVAHYKSGDSIGQTSLDSTQPRTATLLSTSTSIILRLEIEDYRLIMEYYSMKQKSEFKEILMRVRGFEEFSNNKIALISSHLQSKFYIKGEVIYHQDDSSEALFILKQGLVIIESNISLEKENLWPVGNQLWEKCTVVRNKKVSHVVKPLSFFGDMELIRNCDRLNTAVCGEDSHVLILNKRNFSDLFDSNELNLMKLFSEEQIYEDVDKMRKEVIEEEKEKQKMKKIMIKAFTDHLGPLSSSELKKRNSRFEPAIDKLKQDYKIFLKRNTIAEVKVYEKVLTNNTG